MTRTVFAGGQVFDGTGSAPAPADVVVADGRIVAVGPGLDGDRVVDCSGTTLLPGLFDCHVHVTVSDLSIVARVRQPFSYQFYAAARNLATTPILTVPCLTTVGSPDRYVGCWRR